MLYLTACVGSTETRASVEFTTWLSISDSERELKTSVSEKDAGAEILQWRVHVVDECLSTGLQRVLWHYGRLKVFDANGKEQAGTVSSLSGQRRDRRRGVCSCQQSSAPARPTFCYGSGNGAAHFESFVQYPVHANVLSEPTKSPAKTGGSRSDLSLVTSTKQARQIISTNVVLRGS